MVEEPRACSLASHAIAPGISHLCTMDAMAPGMMKITINKYAVVLIINTLQVTEIGALLASKLLTNGYLLC